MPFIEMKTAKATTEQKEKLVAGFTKVASETLGMPASAFFVLIGGFCKIGSKIIHKTMFHERIRGFPQYEEAMAFEQARQCAKRTDFPLASESCF